MDTATAFQMILDHMREELQWFDLETRDQYKKAYNIIEDIAVNKLVKTKSREIQLADAFQHVAKIDHYMVGIAVDYTDNELQEAYQIIIDRDNKLSRKKTRLALDIIEQELVKRRLK